MQFDSLARHSLGHGPLHRLDARWKLLATIGFVILVVCTPPQHARWLAVEGLVLAFAVGLSGAPPGVLARRWLGFLLVIGFLAALVARGHPLREQLGWGPLMAAILMKNTLALVAVLTLSAVTPFPRLLAAMSKLRVPAPLVATLHFMYRYLHVLGEELDRMVQARRARSFRRAGQLDWGLLGGMLGLLFLRALERGERVHAAMLARGWDGTLRTLDGDEPR